MDRPTAIDVDGVPAALELVLEGVEERLGPSVGLDGDDDSTMAARPACDSQQDPSGAPQRIATLVR
jgi:hypothetical protein